MSAGFIANEFGSCPTCDGTGCVCMRMRDWQSIDQGCHDGCPECGLNSCRPPSAPVVEEATT